MKFFSILVLVLTTLTLTAAELEKPATAPISPVNLIPKACENSTNKPLCFSVFNADPTAKNADLQGLAFLALKTAANTAADTSAHVKSLLIQGSIEEPEMEDGLSTCAKSYVDVVDQIEESVDALVSKNIKNVNTWVKAAVADVVTCDDNLNELSAPAAKDLAEKNRVVQELCKNALEVVRVLKHNRN